ncbi:MAG: GAF domain-containing protein [Lachnospiraceae bacterium]|nr:GAF domain-containing protein [Lachnospiraceae bacterium]MBQ9606404.1 GAF domain-containing protein [Lachnospiraceae bacterium]MBR1524301.1 GAF domain-containing protein [Lachnospiraceae bacterium]
MTDYIALTKQLAAFAETENDFVPLLSNASSLLYGALDNINWAGFYLMDKGSLLVGPFQGRPACIRIKVGSGVCGTAVKEGRAIRVSNVHEFPGHIACDSASESEIVIPIYSKGVISGVLDIDSPVLNRFTDEDETGLKLFAEKIGELGDFSRLRC